MSLPYWDDPNFYCHGERCIEGECSPMFCADDASPPTEGDDE